MTPADWAMHRLEERKLWATAVLVESMELWPRWRDLELMDYAKFELRTACRLLQGRGR